MAEVGNDDRPNVSARRAMRRGGVGKAVATGALLVLSFLSPGCSAEPIAPPTTDVWQEDQTARRQARLPDEAIAYIIATVEPPADKSAKDKWAYVRCLGYGAQRHVRRLIVWRRTLRVREGVATPGKVDTDVGEVFLHRGNIVLVRGDGRQWVYDVNPDRLDAVLWVHLGKPGSPDVSWEETSGVIDPAALRAALKELGVDRSALDILDPSS